MQSRIVLFTVILFGFLLYPTLTSSAQSHRLAVSVAHPIPQGGEHYMEYTGLYGMDLEYAYYIYESVAVGVKGGFSKARYRPVDNSLTRSRLVRVHGFLSYPAPLGDQWDLTLQGGVGYGGMAFQNKEREVDQIETGWNIAFLMALERPLGDRLRAGIFTSYELLIMGPNHSGFLNPYNTDAYYVDVGLRLGMVWR